MTFLSCLLKAFSFSVTAVLPKMDASVWSFFVGLFSCSVTQKLRVVRMANFVQMMMPNLFCVHEFLY